MFEFLIRGSQLQQIRAVALSQNGMTGAAIARRDGLLAIGCLVLTVVTAETARPVLVPDVVGVGGPAGLHLREEIPLINLLHLGNHLLHTCITRVFRLQISRYALQRLGLVRVGPRQDEHRVAFHPVDRRIDVPERHRQVDGIVRRLVAVRRPVMAIHAVHPPHVGGIHSIRKFRCPKLRDHTLRIGQPNPGNLLAGFVAGYVFNFVCDIHVVVNATNRTMCGVRATDLHQHPNRELCVGLVGKVIIIGPFQIPHELGGPMALLAGLLCGAQVLDGRGNRTWILVQSGGIHLIGARKF